MVDSTAGKVEQPSVFDYTTDDVRKWQQDQQILKEVKKFFKRVSLDKTKDLLWFIVRLQRFKASDIGTGKTIITHNFKLFNVNEKRTDGDIKLEELKKINVELLSKIFNIVTERSMFEEDVEEHDVYSGKYCVKKFITYDTIRKKLCDEAGNVKLVYNFDKPDLPIVPPTEKFELQRCKVQILSTGVQFDYPLIFNYYCPNCENTSTKKAYEVTSTNNHIQCPHFYTYTNSAGESKTRPCKHVLYPDKDITVVSTGYFYELGYDDGDTKFVASALGFSNYKPGFYECVMYRLSNVGKTVLFLIVDVKKIPPNELQLPEQKEEENYLFTLQQRLDDYIKEKTGITIYGLYPIKCALILQTLFNKLGERLIFNVMIVGDPSTGKSLVLKYYSFLLNNYYNMSSNGLSISIAGLRGTRASINLFGKDIKIVTVGHLGTYNSIHIDEAGENKELVQNLKSFLLEDNYSYDKAGSTGVSNERTAHINVSQNLDHEHVGQYRGAIRKAYKDLNMTISGVEKEDWDEDWDLFLPLHKYDTNPQLRKVIKEKRLEFKQKQVWWIDGLDYALHERFPAYFFLVNEKKSDGLINAVRENATRKLISKNLEVIRAMYTEELDVLFTELRKYQYSENDREAVIQVNKIVKDYGLIFDTRMLNVYYMIVRMSRIINKRMEYTELDYDLVRWFLETTNCKLDIADTDTYKIQGPPNLQQVAQQNKVEEESRTRDELFGLPKDEFP